MSLTLTPESVDTSKWNESIDHKCLALKHGSGIHTNIELSDHQLTFTYSNSTVVLSLVMTETWKNIIVQ